MTADADEHRDGFDGIGMAVGAQRTPHPERIVDDLEHGALVRRETRRKAEHGQRDVVWQCEVDVHVPQVRRHSLGGAHEATFLG